MNKSLNDFSLRLYTHKNRGVYVTNIQQRSVPLCFVLVSSGMIFPTPRLSSLFRGFAFSNSCATVQLSRMQDLSSHSLLLECLYDRSLIQMFLISGIGLNISNRPHCTLTFFLCMITHYSNSNSLSNISRAQLADVLLEVLLDG